MDYKLRALATYPQPTMGFHIRGGDKGEEDVLKVGPTTALAHLKDLLDPPHYADARSETSQISIGCSCFLGSFSEDPFWEACARLRTTSCMIAGFGNDSTAIMKCEVEVCLCRRG